MQVCTLLQTDNHTSTPPLLFFTGRMPFLPPNQQRQSTEDACMQCKKIQRPRFHHCLTPLGELTPSSWLGGSWLPLPQEFKNPIPLSAFHALPLTTRLIFHNSNTGGRAEAMLPSPNQLGNLLVSDDESESSFVQLDSCLCALDRCRDDDVIAPPPTPRSRDRGGVTDTDVADWILDQCGGDVTSGAHQLLARSRPPVPCQRPAVRIAVCLFFIFFVLCVYTLISLVHL